MTMLTVAPPAELWTQALRHLSAKVSPQNYDMWLSPIECLGLTGRVLRLRAPNQYVRLWFENNYLAIVLDDLKADTGVDLSVEFEPEPARPAVVSSGVDFSGERIDRRTLDIHRTGGAGTGVDGAGGGLSAVPEAVVADPSSAELAGTIPPPPLNPRYTFDTFVAGPSNQLAFAASQAAASSYPPKYNPVFLCGGVGLGKTHLLHAIGHYFLHSRPGSRILYMSGERFMNEYVHAIRTNRMHDFRRKYRESCDVLLVDDVQFLAGKDGTQDEFFHTFNALHDAHRQIVLTADRKPHEISDIADRLRTRFGMGLLADIEPPELEVRIAILRKKAAAESIILPDDVALYIASAIKSNVRELEGALIRLAAYASLSRQSINLAFAQETLGSTISRPPEHITVDAVLKVVAVYYGLNIKDLKSERRHKSLAGPRAVAMYLARQHTKSSFPELGRAFGGKHHTTVISAVEKIAKRLKEDPGLRGEIHAIESQLLR